MQESGINAPVFSVSVKEGIVMQNVADMEDEH